MRHLVRALDRYVFAEFWKIFSVTGIGFPVLLIIIDLTDNLGKYLNRNIPPRDLAMSYVYWMPDNMFMVLPAAVLFATVFSIGALTRHSEITAAKASGISFYRMILPILIGAGHEYGVFMVHRYREACHDPRRYWRRWDASDKALLLCAYVTCSSFGFFYLLANHRGLKSLGLVMALGTACIYLATLLVVRPLLLWRLRKRHPPAKA